MKWNWANRITLLRILLIVPFVIFMLKMNRPDITDALSDTFRYAATCIFLIMAVSDAIDGYLARSKGQTTKLGSFLDPTADKLLITCACLLLSTKRGGVEGFQLPIEVVVLIIGKDMFLLIGFVIVYFVTFKVRVIPVLIGKIATALQLSMVAGILLAPEFSRPFPWWIWFLRALWWAAATTAILTTLIYIRTGSHYIEEHEQQNNH